jgi:hypothetical protein
MGYPALNSDEQSQIHSVLNDTDLQQSKQADDNKDHASQIT